MKSSLVLLIFYIVNSYSAVTESITEENIEVNQNKVIVPEPIINVTFENTSITERTTDNFSSEETSAVRTGETSTGTARKLSRNESFTGGCPTGYARADDGSCQELE